MSFLKSLGSLRVGKPKGIIFITPPPRASDWLHVIVSAHVWEFPGFVRFVQRSLLRAHVLYFSSPDVFNDVACLDSKLVWQLEKGDGTDSDDLHGWGINKEHENVRRHIQTTWWHWNGGLAEYELGVVATEARRPVLEN